jgi:hypothetical protein
MKFRFCVAGACGLALAAAGCGGTLDQGKLEGKIRSLMSKAPFNLSVASVTCPSDRSEKKGDRFTCLLTLKNGETATFNITQVDNKGNVNIKLGQEIPTYVQNTIAANLATQGVHATAVCPPHVAVVAGATFKCALTSSSGQHGTATLTILDDTGAFRITGIHSG